MRARPDKLEENILALFNRACLQGRWDIAEHLLRALEVSSERGDDHGLPCARDPLADAYLTIARSHSKQ
ncbi:hypothetical protein HW571_27805 [Agrobacterium genomosp. 3]|uniref:hypothetical protein n=1 Tax=Agrobacterium TaxID=357 RepID=UPI00158668AE|nr:MULTISPECIES: hypothetical protein [Agrobacterium tumefaciens complex]MCA1869424.1 hypothetical protein [Agrobacterium tomkonis]MCA2378813.1 hypothetical protein [Agrobacterium tomkonis RTP8]MCA1879809.1 hypothetical protein [Agrobacterium tumefaciens]MCA1895000.1 hypothetical protein [Agrobacterium tomkonis]MCA2371074.1 hypothetical protein [Agrobacterium tomkonis CIP 111-78]